MANDSTNDNKDQIGEKDKNRMLSYPPHTNKLISREKNIPMPVYRIDFILAVLIF